MASSPTTIEFILHALSCEGNLSAKKMFGEYGIFLDGKMVALVCDDQFFVKPTEAGKAFWGPQPEASPYTGAKPCLLFSDADLRDKARLAELLRITWEELPVPKPRKKAR
jgi:TfoX/Sxy family transcriptional regulator of competence genes